MLSYLRKNGDEHAVVVLNFTPVPRHGYRVGVPNAGQYREILSSDSSYYGGSNVGNGVATTEPTPWMDQPHSIVVTLPPLARHRARAGLELVEEGQARLGRIDVAVEVVFLVSEAQRDAIPVVLSADVISRIVAAHLAASGAARRSR